MSEDRDARIRARAYERWEQEGRPDGRASDHWLDAERDLEAGESGDTGQQGISNHSPAEERQEQRSLPPRTTRKQDAERRGAQPAGESGAEASRP